MTKCENERFSSIQELCTQVNEKHSLAVFKIMERMKGIGTMMQRCYKCGGSGEQIQLVKTAHHPLRSSLLMHKKCEECHGKGQVLSES